MKTTRSRPGPPGGLLAAVMALTMAAWMTFLPSEALASTRPIHFQHLTVDNGLSQSTVLCIHQDSKGFMWFGTEDGLNRYDGYAFTPFSRDASDTTSLPADLVWAITEDAAGRMWVGTVGGGVALYDSATESFTTYGTNEGLASDNVRIITADADGFIWIGTREHGLDRLDPATGEVLHYRHDPEVPTSLGDDHVYALVIDRSNTLWVGTDSGLNRLDPATGAFDHFHHDPADPASLSDDRVRSIVEDSKGTLWVGTYAGGLNRLDRTNGSFVRLSQAPGQSETQPGNRVRSLLEDSTGRLWVGTSAGINILSAGGRSTVSYRHDPGDPRSLGDDHVMSLYEDRGGVIWIGTRVGGLSRWNPATFEFGHHYASASDTEGLNSNNVTTFSEDRGGRLWIGTFGGGLNVMDRVSGAFTHYTKDTSTLSSDRVMALLHDHGGTLWVGTLDGGLNRYDPSSDSFTVFRHNENRPQSLSADGIMSLFEDRRGSLWVGTFGGGLNRLNPDREVFEAFRHDPAYPFSIGSDRVTAITEDSFGSLWVGTDGGGLNRLDPNTGRFERFGSDHASASELDSATVFSVHVDPRGALWVGTQGGGLSKLNDTSVAAADVAFTTYTARHGLANEVVYGIKSDIAGNLWLSTNRGLSRFDPFTETFTNFNQGHGIQANEFNFGASFASTSGELFFGGVNGFNAFAPHRLKRNQNLPPVVLTQVLLFNKPVDGLAPPSELESVELGYRDSMVTFEFAGLDFATPESNRYRYMLEGFESEWIDLGTVRRLTYTNLDPGHYTLRVVAANGDGMWNNEGLSIGLSVAPAPWQTWWAKLGYFLLVSALILGFVRTQRNRLRLEKQYSSQLEDKVHDRTKELAMRATELEDTNRQLREASLTDSLTGLWNRRYLFELAADEVALVRRRYESLPPGVSPITTPGMVFLMIDLDNFKEINDTCGHPAGDEVLRRIRDVLREVCRHSDVLVRWGGDEFLVVAREIDLGQAEALADRIRTGIAKTFIRLDDGRMVRTSCSVGFASYPLARTMPEVGTWEDVLALADSALYAAKRNGRNAWVGLVGTGRPIDSELLVVMRSDPETLINDGFLDVRTSLPEKRNLAWA